MVEGLLGRLRSRFVLVVGKGGVGKTTTAGALALALADRGERVHLLSTDPAHSLADLYELGTAHSAPVPTPCTPRLVVEELDAEAWTRQRLTGIREPLQDLLDRGTWLDPEDVSAFLDLTLPGMDEVAAALRLAELASSDCDRVVVDTAPTGHTLRLLDAPVLVEGWVRAFRAMQEKARVVAEALVRRPVPLAADDVVGELEEAAATFRADVLERGEAVVVDRAGAVVEAETARLMEALERRGMRVAARIRTLGGDDAGPASGGGEGCDRSATPTDGVITVRAPFRTDLVGCDGLRRWGAPPGGSDPVGGHAEGPATAGGEAEDPVIAGGERVRSLDVQLLLLVGKGGVGKSTCAAAIAVLLAQEGPITLLGTDPAGSLHDLLDLPCESREEQPADGSSEAPHAANLRVRQVRAEERYMELRELYRDDVERAFAAVAATRHATLDRRVVASLIDLAPPGIDEIFALLALLEDASPGGTVVVDTAPTGHLVRLVALPEIGLGWTRQLLRTLRKYRGLRGLDALSERLLRFARRLKDLHDRLIDPSRSAAIVVTQPGPLVAAETRRLLQDLQKAEIRVAGVLRNRWPTPRPAVPGALPEIRPPSSADPAGAIEPPFILRAPTTLPPPVGREALLDFTRSWVVDG